MSKRPRRQLWLPRPSRVCFPISWGCSDGYSWTSSPSFNVTRPVYAATIPCFSLIPLIYPPTRPSFSWSTLPPPFYNPPCVSYDSIAPSSTSFSQPISSHSIPSSLMQIISTSVISSVSISTSAAVDVYGSNLVSLPNLPFSSLETLKPIHVQITLSSLFLLNLISLVFELYSKHIFCFVNTHSKLSFSPCYLPYSYLTPLHPAYHRPNRPLLRQCID